MIALLVAAAFSAAPAEVQAAAKAFDDAQFRHDLAALDRMIAPDFVFVEASGKVSGRKELIAAFASPAVRFDPFKFSNRIWIPLGNDGAIVGGTAVVSGTDHGKRFTIRSQYSDTFRKTGGRWQVVYTQVTALPAQ